MLGTKGFVSEMKDLVWSRGFTIIIIIRAYVNSQDMPIKTLITFLMFVADRHFLSNSLREISQAIFLFQTQYIFIYETLVAAISTSAPIPLKDFHLEEILMTRNGGRIIDEEYAVS